MVFVVARTIQKTIYVEGGGEGRRLSITSHLQESPATRLGETVTKPTNSEGSDYSLSSCLQRKLDSISNEFFKTEIAVVHNQFAIYVNTWILDDAVNMRFAITFSTCFAG